jgi:hypothetical protein
MRAVRRVVDRIEGLDPDWIHGMHGGSLPRETIPHFVRAYERSRPRTSERSSGVSFPPRRTR